MIPQVLIILGLLVLYVLSIIALNFADMRAGRTGEPPALHTAEEDRDDHSST
jgi:hypothetical protein